MTRRHFIVRASVTAMTAIAVAAPAVSAMPMRDAGSPAAKHATKVHHRGLTPDPDRVAAAAHAATMRAIGAALMARRCG